MGDTTTVSLFLAVFVELSEAPADEKNVSGGDFIVSDYGINPSPAQSIRHSEGRMTASSSMGSLRAPSPDRKGPWRQFVSGARRFMDAVADIVDLEDDDSVSQSITHSRNASSVSGISALDLEDEKERRGLQFSPGPVEKESVRLGDRVDPLPLLSSAVLLEELNDPILSEESKLVSREDIQSIISHVPLRHRQKSWTLLYSTHRDGISMQTLLRKSKGKAPTVLLVRDMDKHVFGAFCSEPWKLSSRYYGTGETFVFRVEPNPGVWHWWWKKSAESQNDFFMWGTHEAIAVGGAGGYAIWLNSDLSSGLSRSSLTFGNDSLSSTEEFRIGAVELWGLG